MGVSSIPVYLRIWRPISVGFLPRKRDIGGKESLDLTMSLNKLQVDRVLFCHFSRTTILENAAVGLARFLCLFVPLVMQIPNSVQSSNSPQVLFIHTYHFVHPLIFEDTVIFLPLFLTLLLSIPLFPQTLISS